MKQRLDKVQNDTLIRIEPDAAYIYTVDRSMLIYLKKLKAEPFVYDEGEVVEWKVSKGNIALVDVAVKGNRKKKEVGTPEEK